VNHSHHHEHRMLVAGKAMQSEDGRTLPVTNPYDGSDLGPIPDATATDVAYAVDAAHEVFDDVWVKTPGVERARLMHRLADGIERRADEIGRIETQDNGKLLRETTAQARFAARNYRFFAGYADKVYGRSIPLDNMNTLDYTRREPVGVAALITAWNSPMQLLANKLAPALAAGNCVVVKPSEHASLSTLLMAEILEEAGFPAGVVNIVTGGPRVGKALTEDTRLGRISFTGSVPTGQAIAESAARTLVPVTLELGGKSPNIVFADADLDRAVTGAVTGIFAAGGQTCIAGSRLLVQREVYAEMVERIATRARAIVLGDPMDPGTHMGPVANRPQLSRIEEMVAAGHDSGARLVAGDEAVRDDLRGGLFVRPTVFADVDPESRIAQEEIFGPVLAILPFDDEDEAVRIANSTQYGLAAGVWTRDLARAHRMARRLVAGTVWVNTYRASEAQAPFGGMRRSGHGRERGAEALEDYLRTKNVMVDLSETTRDPFGLEG
jgi:(Z)-2-((N-methylformamido)methylene)-5-hydroxybutyrolactone dehydrogenase